MKATRDYQMAVGKSSPFHKNIKPAWELDEIQNAYDKERDKWHNETRQSLTKKKVKPDPATVEAELQLEENLWNS